MTIPSLIVVTSRKTAFNENNITNGAVSRLIAWTIVQQDVEVISYSKLDFLTFVGKQCQSPIVLDLTGEKVGAILRARLQFRRYSVSCFRQDSQVRYFWSKLRQERNFDKAVVAAANTLRAVVRESTCSLIFRRVGYVSEQDFLFQRRSFVIRLLHSNLNYARSRGPMVPAKIRSLCVVGNFSYGPNVDGLKSLLCSKVFIETCRVNDINIRICGRAADSFIEKLLPDKLQIIDIERSGEFSQFTDLYSPDQIFLCPVFYGSGVKNKIIQAQEIDSITLAWRGVAKEFPYSPLHVDYFDHPDDLSEYLQFIIQFTRETSPLSFFEVAELFKIKKYLLVNP